MHACHALFWGGSSVPGLPEQDDGDAATGERRLPHPVLQAPDTALLCGHRVCQFARCRPYATDDDAASRGALASALVHVQL